MSKELHYSHALTLPPAEAIKYLKSKGYLVTWSWREQLVINNAQVFTVARAMQMDILQDIRGMLTESLKSGLSFRDFKLELEPMLKAKGWWGWKTIDGERVQLGSPHRLKTIYSTNMNSSFNTGRWKAFEDNKDNRPFLQYVAVMDPSTRDSHAALNGQIHPVDSPFWNINAPPNGYNSFVPDTQMKGTFDGGSKRSYSGEIVTIKTAKGRNLSVTPNHPIPTPFGFVSAGNLSKGSDIFGYSGSAKVMVNGTPAPSTKKNDNINPTIKEFYNFINKMGALSRGEIGSDDFHGDVSEGDADIYIVCLKSPLGNGIQSLLFNDFEDFTFKSTYSSQITHLTFGTPEFFLERALSSSGSNPSLAALADHSQSIMLNLLPFKTLSLPSTTGDYAVYPEVLPNDLSAHSIFFRKLLNRYPGIIQLDEVVSVTYNDFTGHVYDLQSPSSLIIANNILISNCRCRLRALSKLQAERAGGISTPPKETVPHEAFRSNSAKEQWRPKRKDYDADIWNTIQS